MEEVFQITSREISELHVTICKKGLRLILIAGQEIIMEIYVTIRKSNLFQGWKKQFGKKGARGLCVSKQNLLHKH